MFSTADPSPKLMQLRQTKALCVLNQQHAGVGDIHTDLEYSRADQRICLAAPKAFHDLLLFNWRNAAVKQLAAKRMQQFPPQRVLRCIRFDVYFFAFMYLRITTEDMSAFF